MSIRAACFGWLLLLGLGSARAPAADDPPAPAPVSPDHAKRMQAGLELFKAKVRPVLVAQCLECHGGKSVKADLDISTREALVKSGAIDEGAESSTLFLVAAHREEPFMPHKRPKLPDDAIADLGRWIDLGAPYDKPLVDRAAGAAKPSQRAITDADRQYWAFRPLQTPPLPEVSRPDWIRTPIDRFLLAAMDAHKVAPVGDADRRTLIRRVYFDLVGLPPEPEEVEAFVAAPDLERALEALVDKLLASPHYGERWARHWLDPARYAESHGFEHDYDRPYAYHYRDFVIRALNQDMPFDQFVRWQVAGDEIAPDNPDAMAATGFLGAGVYPTQITNSEAERIRYDAMDDMLASTGLSVLGLTIGCARCHDHKYDPIPAADYYRMLSAFTSAVRSEVDWDFGTPEEQRAMREYEAEHKHLDAERKRYENQDLPKQLLARIEADKQAGKELPKIDEPQARQGFESIREGKQSLDQIEKPKRDALLAWYKPQDAGWKERDEAIRKHEATKPKETRTKIQACTEGRKPMRHHTADPSIPDFYEKTYQLDRGDVAQKKGEAELGFLQILTRHPDGPRHWEIPRPTDSPSSYRRIAMAEWLTDAESGAGHLTARVIVNRLWHHHFGRGLVATINDFGIQAEPPTHPELLEWLARDLIEHGWALKRLHKQIVLSHAYRLSGATTPENHQADPDNRWWWHRPRRRLEAEVIRDNLLAVGGLLDRTMFGPGTLDEGMTRRSIYFQVKRSQLIPMLQVFDWPDTLTSAAARPTTVTAPQALLFLNSPHVRRWGEGFASRLKPAAGRSPSEAVDLAFRIAFARPPGDAERAAGIAFLASGGKSPDQALVDYALALMSLNEFIYVD